MWDYNPHRTKGEGYERMAALVHTPDGNIPVAEVYTVDGVVFLRFKKPRNQGYEEITLDQFIYLLFTTMENEYLSY